LGGGCGGLSYVKARAKEKKGRKHLLAGPKQVFVPECLDLSRGEGVGAVNERCREKNGDKNMRYFLSGKGLKTTDN